MTEERNQRIAAENREKDQNKRMQRQMRDMKEEMGELSKKEAEASRKKHELVRLWMLGDLIPWSPPGGGNRACSLLWSIHQEMDIESLEAANQSLQVDLKLAFKRIGDLQAAIEDEMESDDNDDLINRYSAPLICYKWIYSCLFLNIMCAWYIRGYRTVARGPSTGASYLCELQETYQMRTAGFFLAACQSQLVSFHSVSSTSSSRVHLLYSASHTTLCSPNTSHLVSFGSPLLIFCLRDGLPCLVTPALFAEGLRVMLALSPLR